MSCDLMLRSSLVEGRGEVGMEWVRRWSGCEAAIVWLCYAGGPSFAEDGLPLRKGTQMIAFGGKMKWTGMASDDHEPHTRMGRGWMRRGARTAYDRRMMTFG